MIRISPSERKYMVEGVEQNIRCDGRGRLDFRPLTIESGFLPQANGSARVSLVNDSSDIVAAVKAEFGPVDPDTPKQGKLGVSVECCPSVSPKLEGRVGATINADLTSMLENMLVSSNGLDLKELCVVPDKFAWKIYVDVMVLDSGGNIFDLVSLAAYAALRNARLPRLRVVEGVDSEGEANVDVELTDDPDDTVALVGVEKLPLAVTLSQVGTKFIVDATGQEEGCVDCRVQLAVDSEGQICGIQKKFSGCFQPSEVWPLLQAARHIGSLLFKEVDATLKKEEEVDEEEMGSGSIVSTTLASKLGFMA